MNFPERSYCLPAASGHRFVGHVLSGHKDRPSISVSGIQCMTGQRKSYKHFAGVATTVSTIANIGRSDMAILASLVMSTLQRYVQELPHVSAKTNPFYPFQTIGLTALRLSDSPVLPLNITRYALELPSYLEQLQATAKAAEITDVDFSKINKAIIDIEAAAHHLDSEIADVLSILQTLYSGDITDKKDRKKKQRRLIGKLRSINKRKMSFERGFISKEGLPRRPWYKHLGVAPGENLGVSC